MTYLSTELSIALVLLRTILGVVFFMHGAQKVLGWFGGHGLKATVGYFKDNLQIPTPLGYLAAIAEFFGSMALILGLLTQAAALGILVTMIVATLRVHGHAGFFLSPKDPKRGQGFEYSLTLGVIALVVLILGGGAYSLDAVR